MAEPQSQASNVSQWTELSERFESQWSSGETPRIEDALPKVPQQERRNVFRRLLAIELDCRARRGESCDRATYRERFPEYADEVELEFDDGVNGESTGATVASTVDIASAGVVNSCERRPGESVGRYRLNERIGEGGFGEVWTAHDGELDRVVAIKFSRTGTAVSPSFGRKFRDEARKAGRLTHPGIVPVYDVQDEDGGFIVAEYINGPTLKQRIAEGPVATETAVELIAKIADALHFAHTQDLVHRDVKPANILLRPNGDPVLTDFGLAISEIELLDESASIVGTRSYMSPEQANGQVNLTDARTDVYSLGVILYELLTGRPPFLARNLREYVDQVSGRNPRPLRTIDDSIDPQLERICLRCLERSTSDRYTTCGEIAEALRAFQSRGKVASEKAKRWWMAAGSLAAIGVIVAIVAWTFDGNRGKGGAGAGESSKTKTGANQSTAVPERDADGWTALLDKPPKILAWRRIEGRENPQFDADQRRYAVRSDHSEWVVSAGEIDSRPYEARAAIQIENWVGIAGLVFAFQRDSREVLGKNYRGLIVDYYRLNPAQPAQLRVRHLELERIAFDHLRIKSFKGIAHKTIPTPKGEHAEIRISVEKTGIVVHWTESGRKVEWKPRDLFNEAEWLPNGRTEVGMTGSGREVVFRDLSYRHTLTRK